MPWCPQIVGDVYQKFWDNLDIIWPRGEPSFPLFSLLSGGIYVLFFFEIDGGGSGAPNFGGIILNAWNNLFWIIWIFCFCFWKKKKNLQKFAKRKLS